MNRRLARVAAVVLVGGLAAAAALYYYALGPSEQPTSDPQAARSLDASGRTLYSIVPAESEARFLVDEVLRGQDNLVVGTTDQLMGDIAVDLENLASAEMSTIVVNARTLVTDDDRRNRAIRNFILDTDTHEFISFSPRLLLGLTGRAEPGDRFVFQVFGELMIRGVSKEVVFDVDATVEAPDRMSGTAHSTVFYRDFNLTIPDVPFVASVDEEVKLELDFVAVADGD